MHQTLGRGLTCCLGGKRKSSALARVSLSSPFSNLMSSATCRNRATPYFPDWNGKRPSRLTCLTVVDQHMPTVPRNGHKQPKMPHGVHKPLVNRSQSRRIVASGRFGIVVRGRTLPEVLLPCAQQQNAQGLDS